MFAHDLYGGLLIKTTSDLPVHLPVQVWSFVCAYIIILLVFWSPERKLIFRLLSVPAWTALLFHVVTIFGPFRVPAIVSILILITVSVATGCSETSSASTDGKNYVFTLFHSNKQRIGHQLF